MVSRWLDFNMCDGDKERVDRIMKAFSNHREQYSHARHISKGTCIEVGINISNLEDNQELQDAVLTTHHLFMHTFSNTSAVKIIENQNEVAYIENQTTK
jgi:hypothetical protein